MARTDLAVRAGRLRGRGAAPGNRLRYDYALN